MIREFVLQMKLGHVQSEYFQQKVRSRRAAAVRRPIERPSKSRAS